MYILVPFKKITKKKVYKKFCGVSSQQFIIPLTVTITTLQRGVPCENHTWLSKLELKTPLVYSLEFPQSESVRTWLLLDPTCCYSITVLLLRNETCPDFQSIHTVHKTTLFLDIRPHLLQYLSIKKKSELRIYLVRV